MDNKMETNALPLSYKGTNALRVLLEIMTANNTPAMKKMTETMKKKLEIGKNFPKRYS